MVQRWAYNGAGTVFFDKGKKRWVAAVQLPPGPDGNEGDVAERFIRKRDAVAYLQQLAHTPKTPEVVGG